MKTQLNRSMTNKVVGGVAGGVADAFGWDPTLVRVGFVLLTLAHGVGLGLYLLLLLVMPKAGQASIFQQVDTGLQQKAYSLPNTDRNHKLGYTLLAVGMFMLASMLNITGPVIALMVIAAGYYLLKHS